MTRTGGLNGDYKSIEIDVDTGFFFNQANKKGKLTPEDVRKLDEIIDSDQFKSLDPKYTNPNPLSTPNSYRYTVSYSEKRIGSTFDVSTKYPDFLDQLISIFEKYAI
ncbi:hypothetical protein PPL_06373 [Heterostelium album PN500]|uniref:Uncharacterized protein n=1 Tax=Heterostelium pallidum (strain ATCC 26659 / Pp 5 / PN500) TaxID=670386 RepID=D3BCZ5_HETP5|nr:hypothetical protein PPL_06373 [Heterostelium album PN500]EFA80787.1 hypothetical protein PPL_06373 [Heterostelium album PN500]|eukprot:XP_020432906.1 hypothetical protein PPL_06373 [Heterostelium album PN500]